MNRQNSPEGESLSRPANSEQFGTAATRGGEQCLAASQAELALPGMRYELPTPVRKGDPQPIEPQIQALRDSELNYRRLFEAARDGIFILDLQQGRICDVNPFLVELLEFTSAEMIGKTIGELSPFKDIESNQVMLEKLQTKGYVRYDHLPLETKSGRTVDVEFVSNVYEVGDRKVIQCNIRDITTRRHAEIASNRMAAIVEFSEDAIIGKDTNGIVTSWNPGAERIFGYGAGEMIGLSVMTLVPSDRAAEEREILETIRRGESVKHFETLRKTKDGRLVDVSVSASPIKDKTGRIVGVSKIVRNITETKLNEKKIHQLNVDLEQRVADRTEQLQAANLELEAFSYSVSHDLRAPLRHILGFIELLKNEANKSLSQKSIHLLATIAQSAQRMGHLIDGLLAFARIGKAALKKTDVNLDRLVHETLEDIRSSIRDRSLTWTLHPLPTVWAERELLRLVFVNLISNAVKFTATRNPGIVEIGWKMGDEAEIILFIRDNGVGFDSRYSEKLFGVFQRLHSQDEFEGTGIGLANVKRIVLRHGGRVWAESKLNEGAVFYFSLPTQSGRADGI